jgi:putative hydroxymethylpyrimidine transport system substrate-binding protein
MSLSSTLSSSSPSSFRARPDGPVEPRASRRALLAATVLPLTTSVVQRTAAQEPLAPVTVALDWYPNANHAGLFLALENGWFAEDGLEIELYTPSDPTTVLQTVGAGRDTLGISYQTDVLLARAQGVPVVSVAAIAQQPLMGIMTLAEANLERPADLAGKTVAYPGIPSQEAFLATMLETDGLTMEDIDLVNVGFDLLPAVVSGRAAGAMGAFWTHEPIVAEQAGYAVSMMRVDDFGVPPYYELVMVAGEQTLSNDPDTVRAFLRAMVRGYDAAAADPEAALAALAAASPDIDLAVETEGLALTAPTWTADGVTVGSQTVDRWDAYAAWMAERDLIPADLDPAAAWTDALLRG